MAVPEPPAAVPLHAPMVSKSRVPVRPMTVGCRIRATDAASARLAGAGRVSAERRIPNLDARGKPP
jgi:hypothetical protein